MTASGLLSMISGLMAIGWILFLANRLKQWLRRRLCHV